MEKIYQILSKGTKSEKKALLAFNRNASTEEVVLKYNIWARYFFNKYFTSDDAPFHKVMDYKRARLYLGLDPSFLNIAFRDSAKTTKAKLFRDFVIANDKSHYRKYLRVLSKDLGNAKQSVTDVYNMLVSHEIRDIYPEIFEKTLAKREETMSAFTTSTGIKMIADTVGTDKRGDIQEESRPDFDWYDDFETRLSLMSAVNTNKIWINMEEARTGLAKNGGSEYTCNYISERGNVHKLKDKIKNQIIIPIIENGIPTWNRFTVEDIRAIKKDTDDFEGEYLCEPSASKNVLFDRASINEQVAKEPIKVSVDFRMYKVFDASHRYGAGADIAGGVGLDSSTSVFIDFDTLPAQVVGTFNNNEIKPDIFGDELKRQGEKFGECLIAPENNKFDMAIGRLKQIYPTDKIYKTEQKSNKVQSGILTTYGWNTNALTKPKMMLALSKAVENGWISLNDPALIAEARTYTRDDLMDADVDPRLVTRHFDLLIACAIAWQMKDLAEASSNSEEELRMAINRSERLSTKDYGI